MIIAVAKTFVELQVSSLRILVMSYKVLNRGAELLKWLPITSNNGLMVTDLHSNPQPRDAIANKK